MSPAQITEHAEQDKEIIALARGFDTLIETIQKLTWQERELWNKLQFAHDEVRLPPFSSLLSNTHYHDPHPFPFPLPCMMREPLALDQKLHLCGND